MDSAHEHLIERSKYYVSDKSGWFYEARVGLIIIAIIV